MKMNKVESSPQPNNIALPELKKCLLSFISVFLLRESLLVILLVKPDLSPGTLHRNTRPQNNLLLLFLLATSYEAGCLMLCCVAGSSLS